MKKIFYLIVMLALVLAGCKEKNEVEGEYITIRFSMESEWSDDGAQAPGRMLPGDPGNDDFVAPQHLYFAVYAENSDQSAHYIKTCHITNAVWKDMGKGIYYHENAYKFKLPATGGTGLYNGKYHVVAYASAIPFSASTAFDGTYTEGETLASTGITLTTLENMTYSIPSLGGKTQSEFFRSVYSTAFSETDHSQMATSPTVVLRHTAARLDLQWNCDTTIHKRGLNLGSTLTVSRGSMPTAYSLYKPGKNGTGSATWSEAISINEGNRYNGRYVTYLPMPATPTFTVTSNNGNINGSSTTKELPLSAGADFYYATWMRALWTIK